MNYYYFIVSFNGTHILTTKKFHDSDKMLQCASTLILKFTAQEGYKVTKCIANKLTRVIPIN